MRNLVLVEHDPFFEEILIMAALEQLIDVSASFGPTAIFSNGKNACRQMAFQKCGYANFLMCNFLY